MQGLGDPPTEGVEVDGGGGARKVVAGVELDVGLLKERDPQLVARRREAAQQRRGTFLHDREVVVNGDLAHRAIQVHLDHVLARRAQHRDAVALREDVARDERAPEAPWHKFSEVRAHLLYSDSMESTLEDFENVCRSL